ncbi:MAG: hypothetical protein H8D46_04960 [FCB group bacterium]|nr:hypothetical protein [FCB group bacterium]
MFNWIYLIPFGIFSVIVFSIRWWVSRHPGSWLVKNVVGRRFGFRTDTRNMTRRQLLQSGRKSIYYTLFFLSQFMVFTYIWHDFPEPVEMGIIFSWFLLILMFAVTSIYLSIRGLFRSRTWTPPPQIKKT